MRNDGDRDVGRQVVGAMSLEILMADVALGSDLEKPPEEVPLAAPWATAAETAPHGRADLPGRIVNVAHRCHLFRNRVRLI